ncbi:unnamed protein product [Nippostrongylus brasiliensis]|uniref:Peptidase S1 domain-containing protein n=1 Tax=Nippostrongylus brasiliensis TaxID=27835 RepID=A0A158R0L3_NIPBR|nr:unnamed protein product [Nippostrongylus brasiliensis]
MAHELLLSLALICSASLIAQGLERLSKITSAENSELNKQCTPQAPVPNRRNGQRKEERVPIFDVTPGKYRRRRIKRMMNGEKVTEAKYNVMINLMNGKSRCTGVLISSKHVLTAAHCFVTSRQCLKGAEKLTEPLYKKTEYPVEVHYGGTCAAVLKGGGCPASEKTKTAAVAHVGVSRRYFASKCLSGDIAIVELAEPLTGLYETACLPSNTTRLQSQTTMSGYGYDPMNGWTKEKFLEKVTLMKERYCDPSITRGKDTFCLRQQAGSPCRGDSGAGVMQRANDAKDYVMGVLSKGLNCNDLHTALVRRYNDNREFRGMVITNTRDHLDWICLHTGVCEEHVDPKTMSKVRIAMIF